jgi:hypothetical protein
MTMRFDVLPSVPLEALQDGQYIHFSMVEEDANDWVIDQVHIMGKAPDHEDHDHD